MKNFLPNFHIKTRGVSLFELIIAITISGFVLTGVMMSYVSLTKAAQKIDIARQLQREINFAMARMSDRVRGFSIDYTNCDNYKNNLHKLCIKEGGTFEFDENGHQLNMNGQPLFSDLFSVNDVQFNVTPVTDPGKTFGEQPRAQIYLKVGLSERAQVSMKDFEVQTTISSRLYK